MNRSWPAATLLLCASALAQTPSPEQQREADLSRIRSRIATLKEQVRESEKHAASLSEEIKRLDWKLEIGDQEQKLLAARRDEIARQLSATRQDRAEAASAVSASRLTLAARARVLQRFGRYGYFRLLLEARDIPGFLQGVERLDALARRDGRLLAANRAAQSRLDDDLAREQALKSDLDGIYARSRRELLSTAAMRRQRETLLARERSSSASRRGEVAVLSDKADRLERLLDTLTRQSPEEPEDGARGIRPWKGVLDWPAQGSLLETYGRHRHPRFDAWTVSNGISIGLPAGTSVRAVYAGKVVYAQWLAEYGNLVILDHGDGMLTLYAWLQTVAVGAGSRVAAGDPVGTAGSGPGREETGVYFEVRDRQKAVDPVAWLR
jgi:septal ring factor EnvC (AmiA/AmiB activator)